MKKKKIGFSYLGGGEERLLRERSAMSARQLLCRSVLDAL